MNTPHPCCLCAHLYYDAMWKNDPSYESECKLGLERGDPSCPKFEPDARILREIPELHIIPVEGER